MRAAERAQVETQTYTLETVNLSVRGGAIKAPRGLTRASAKRTNIVKTDTIPDIETSSSVES